MINDKDLGITKEEDMVEQMGDDRWDQPGKNE